MNESCISLMHYPDGLELYDVAGRPLAFNHHLGTYQLAGHTALYVVEMAKVSALLDEDEPDSEAMLQVAGELLVDYSYVTAHQLPPHVQHAVVTALGQLLELLLPRLKFQQETLYKALLKAITSKGTADAELKSQPPHPHPDPS